MAKVNILLKLLPEDPGKGFDETIEQIKAKSKELNFILQDYREEEIAFGIKNLYVLITMEEKNELLSKVEEALGKLVNVGNLEVVRISLA